MHTPFFLKTCAGKSLDEDGLSSYGGPDQQTLDGNWDAFTLTTAGSPTGSLRTRFSSLPPPAQSRTPSAFELGPPLPTQRTAESIRSPACPSLVELCSLCDEVGRRSEGPQQCPPAVMKLIAVNAPYLVVTQRGCPALIRVYERVSAMQKGMLVAHLLPRLAALSMDAFANYMVQCIMEATDATVAARYVTNFLAGHLLQMSCDKYASNVVEKVVRVCGGDPAVNRLLLDELIFNPAAVRRLVSDNYGNFVLQSVVVTVPNLAEIGRVSRILSPLLAQSAFATNIWARVTSRRRDLSKPLRSAATWGAFFEVESPCSPPAYPVPQHDKAESTAESLPTVPLVPWSTAFNTPAAREVGHPQLSAGRYRHTPYNYAHSESGTEDTPVFSGVLLGLEPKASDSHEPPVLNRG